MLTCIRAALKKCNLQLNDRKIHLTEWNPENKQIYGRNAYCTTRLLHRFTFNCQNPSLKSLKMSFPFKASRLSVQQFSQVPFGKVITVYGILMFERCTLMLSAKDGKSLSGYQATKALDNYIHKLEKRKVKGLTEKQVSSLIKTAKVLKVAVIQSGAKF